MLTPEILELLASPEQARLEAEEEDAYYESLAASDDECEMSEEELVAYLGWLDEMETRS